MDEYVFEELNSRNNEIQRLKADSIQAGFMENRYPNATYPFNPGFTPYNPTMVSLYDRILEKVTGTELTILCRTRYNSPKAQILEYVKILERLIEDGIFDAPEMPQYQTYTNPWGGGFGATCEAVTETEETEKAETETETATEIKEAKTEEDKYKDIKKALSALMKACDETGTTIITAIQNAVSDEDK